MCYLFLDAYVFNGAGFFVSSTFRVVCDALQAEPDEVRAGLQLGQALDDADHERAGHPRSSVAGTHTR